MMQPRTCVMSEFYINLDTFYRTQRCCEILLNRLFLLFQRVLFHFYGMVLLNNICIIAHFFLHENGMAFRNKCVLPMRGKQHVSDVAIRYFL